MTDVCFYFQAHQPLRLKKFSFFDIGKQKDYFDRAKNKEVLERVVRKCYLPANKLILKLINDSNGAFKVNYSITGILLEQLEECSPESIESFQALVDSGYCELFNETYYHSLSWLVSEKEFSEQIKLHKKKVKELFGVKPKVFRNTESMYSDKIAETAKKLGFKGIVCEGTEKILGWRSPNYVYRAPSGIGLLTRNYKLSDDIAFRFSERKWNEYPLTSEKFASWINASQGHCVNLFLDYETFGEHQWPETGIFKFLSCLPKEILARGDGFATATELIGKHKEAEKISVPEIISWADTDRDLSAWLENGMQNQAFTELKSLEGKLKGEKLENWRKLQISDHFYYMCTKWFSDGDVHKYFNPYENPYDAFINYMNVLTDLKQKTEF